MLWVLLAREPPGLDWGGGGGDEVMVKYFIVDTGFQETSIGTSVGEWMYVADPHLVSAGSFPLVATDAMWGRDALKLTCDPVRSNTGQAVRQHKRFRIYDPRALNSIFTFGDYTVRYCPLAVTCKLDSPWLSPNLFVSLCGWAVGVQLQPDCFLYTTKPWRRFPNPGTGAYYSILVCALQCCLRCDWAPLGPVSTSTILRDSFLCWACSPGVTECVAGLQCAITLLQTEIK